MERLTPSFVEIRLCCEINSYASAVLSTAKEATNTALAKSEGHPITSKTAAGIVIPIVAPVLSL